MPPAVHPLISCALAVLDSRRHCLTSEEIAGLTASNVAYKSTKTTRSRGIDGLAAVQAALIAARLVIVCPGRDSEQVPKVFADKIAECDASLVVHVNKSVNEIDADDPHAAFQIPDDSMWREASRHARGVRRERRNRRLSRSTGKDGRI